MLQRDADDAAGQIDRPADAVGIVAADLVDGGEFGRGEILVPAELLEHAIGELGIAVGELRALAVGAFGQQVDVLHRTVRLLLFVDHAETRAERAAAVLGVKVGVVERMRSRMLDLRRAPARPRQAVIVAADFRLVGLGAQGHQVELALVLHVRLQPLRRLAGIAGRESAAVDFAQQVFRRRPLVLDLDVLEHPVGETELLRQPVDDLVIVLRFEDRLDDLLAPLQRAVGRGARARGFELGAGRQQIGAVLAVGDRRERGRMRIGDHEQFELLEALHHFGHARDGIAAVPHDDHALHGIASDRRHQDWPASHRTSGSTGCPAVPCSACGCGPDGRPWPALRRSATADNRIRLPRPAPSASRRLRPGRNRAAAS